MTETGFSSVPGGPGDVPALGGLDRWPTNAALMVDVAKLGYLGNLVTDPILDVTYGKGNFWKLLFVASVIVTNDLDPDKGADHQWDYRTPAPIGWVDEFHTVVLDPPYKLNGTAGEQEHSTYGVGDGATNGERLEGLVTGIWMASRCVRAGGFLLVKSQSQVAGGRVRWQPRKAAEAVEQLHGWAHVDEFIFQNRPRPQPGNRVQQTARRNYSVLSVFKRLR